MPGRELPVVLLVVVFLGLAAVVVGVVRGGDAPPLTDRAAWADPRYFHDPADRGVVNPADVTMQVKGVAAHRHAAAQDLRRLVEDHVEGRDGPLGRQRVDVGALNRALDERWPLQ